MIFTILDYDGRKMLEVRLKKGEKLTCAYLLYNEGEYETAKKKN